MEGELYGEDGTDYYFDVRSCCSTCIESSVYVYSVHVQFHLCLVLCHFVCLCVPPSFLGELSSQLSWCLADHLPSLPILW